MVKFLCDGMLGRIARWLRLLGYDTLYSSLSTDEELVRLAEEEERVLLTKDVELYRHALKSGVKTLLVEGNDFETMLAHIIKCFDILPKINPESSRCPECNGEMQHIPVDEAKKLKLDIPETTLKVYKDFWVCKNCHKIYWKGRMWSNMVKTLERVKEKVKASHISNFDNPQ